MIRIITRLGEQRWVRTYFCYDISKWITQAFWRAKVLSAWETDSYQVAGQNHLIALGYFSGNKEKENL